MTKQWFLQEQTSPDNTLTEPHVLVRQGATSQSANAVTTSSVTLPSPALAGSIIVVGFGGDKNSGTVSFSDNTGSGTWNVVHNLAATSVTLATAWKVAVGGEQTITETHVTSQASGNTLGVLELTDDRGGTPQLLGSASNINTGDATSLTVSTGSDTPAAESLAIGFAAIDSATNVVAPATISWSNDYAERINNQTGGGRGSIFMATAYVPGGASTSSTLTSANGALADQWSGALLVLGAPNVQIVSPSAIGSGEAFGTAVVSAGVHSPVQGHFRWYTDAADGSMTALAAEDTAPTLTGAQMQNAILRLRVAINETGAAAGSGTAVLQYRESGTASAWTSLQGQTPTTNFEGIWFRYANGAATAGNTLTSNKLTGTTDSGIYIEATATSVSVPASSKTEIDYAILIHWPPPDTTVEFRILYAGSQLALGSGQAACTLTTSTAANRPNTVVRLDGDTVQKTTREVRFAPWRRVFWDSVGGNYWLFTVQYNTPTVIRSYYWSGTGAWTAGATYTSAQNAFQTRAAFVAKQTGTGLTIYVHSGTSSSTRLFNRGTISGTTLTWGTEQSLSQATDRHTHIAIDDGGFVYATGVTAGSGVWSRRASSADSVSAWDTVVTAADTALVSGDLMASIGLASGKVMLLWRSSTGTAIKYVVITNGVAGTVGNATITSAVNAEDWGIARANGYVWLVHSDANGAGGSVTIRTFDESTGTWTGSISPPIPTQVSSNDGYVVAPDTNGIIIFWTALASEGGQDRKIGYVKYTGTTGASGSSGTVRYVDTGGRVNSDHITGCATPGANNMFLVLSAANDDETTGNARTIEYFEVGALTATAPTAVSSAEAFGTPNLGGASTVTLNGIASAEAFGTSAITAVITVSPTGLASGETLGATAVTTFTTLSPNPLTSAETFGSLTISSVITLTPTGVASGEAFGVPSVSAVITASPTAIGSSEAFGTAVISAVFTASPTGIASGETFGTPVLGGTVTLSPSGVASSEAIGLAVAGAGTIIGTTGIGSAEAFGSDTAHRNPLLPLRGAFYYPWFTQGSDPSYPGAWNQGGIKPWTQYHPKLGYYNSATTSVIDNHIGAMQYGKFQVGISSWWGPGSREDDTTPSLLARAAALGTDFKWCLYYEAEGNAISGASGSPNPTVSQIVSDLNYITANYTSHPNYLRVNGKPVIFVYGDPTDDDTSTTVMADRPAARWEAAIAAANEDWYYVLKVYHGYQTDHASHPASSWHQYGPASRGSAQGTFARTISPGFWLTTETTARLDRSPSNWATDIRAMLAANVDWRLVTSFNEFGEGHPVENVDGNSGRDYTGSGWDSDTGYGLYLDYLALDGPVLLAGIASSEAFGTPTISQTTLTTTLSPSGVSSAEAVGTLAVTTTVNVSPSGITSGETLGAVTVVFAGTVAPSGIVTGAAVGTPAAAATYTANPTGIASLEAVPGPVAASVTTASPTGITSGQSFGTLNLASVTVATLSGIATAQAFGTLDIINQNNRTVNPTGIGSSQSFGILDLSYPGSAAAFTGWGIPL